MGVILNTGKVETWEDQSGNGHHLTQGTALRRPVVAAASLGGRDCIRFGNGDAALNRWMDWTSNWAHTEDESMFAVFRYVASPTSDFQILVLGVLSMSRYIANNNTDKSMIFDGAVRAQNGTSLVNGTPYLVEWSTEDLTTSKKFYTRVNEGSETAETPGGTVAVDFFNCLGMDTGIVTSQDLQSDIAEIFVYDHKVGAPERARIYDYVRTWYDGAVLP